MRFSPSTTKNCTFDKRIILKDVLFRGHLLCPGTDKPTGKEVIPLLITSSILYSHIA